MVEWDPQRYVQFSSERGRPFADLIARIHGEANSVVDLGCGPGQLTAGLVDRWPSATVLGLDSSESMIQTAQELPAEPRLQFRQQDVREWIPEAGVDVIVSNAALQWIPGHRDLLARWVEALTPGARLAFQVPGNFGEPSHRLLHDLAADPRFAAWTTGVERPASFEPTVYLDDLVRLGCRVDAWETTYLHILTGDDPVFAWISGTGARPVLQALPEPQHSIFVTEYRAALRAAYPTQPYGVVLPFRRIFVVAQKS